jgi:hypothetical protein
MPIPQPDDYDLPEDSDSSDSEEEFTVFKANRQSQALREISRISTDFELEVEDFDV